MRKVLILWLYRVLTLTVFPLLLLYVVWRSVRDRHYARGITERFGFLPASFQRTGPGAVWLHAVSVGEVLSSVPLIRRLREALPGVPVFVSCTTVAGREVAGARLTGLADGVFYGPVDAVSCVRRVLRRVRPSCVVVLETEIWPNLYRETRRAGCALVIVNGRISNKALPRYGRFAWFFGPVLHEPDAILVQSAEDEQRYITAGAPAERVTPAGNLKYDFDPHSTAPPEPLRLWLERATGPLWVTASTVAPEYPGDVDEDDAVLAAYTELRRDFPDLRLLVAPRKPERFDTVAAKMSSARVGFVRRSAMGSDETAPVLLLDSLGELSSVFSAATVVFVGGTLADRGGHNILEPALFSVPIVVGPHLENFAEIQQHFRSGSGFVEIVSPAELAGAVRDLLRNSGARRDLGARAHVLAEAERGATRTAVNAILAARDRALPLRVTYTPLKPFLWLLSQLWIAGGIIKRALATERTLAAPVISIGGLAMGGVGKTPMVRHLVRVLDDSGLKVAVLTRGYRRHSREPLTILEPGSAAPVAVTGDEAQLILRDATAHVGIGVDRYAAGIAIQQQLKPDVFLLDDGFQHARVHKDFELVLLDGLDPFAGGFVFPRGRLREPISALARAHAVIITRAENGNYEAVRSLIARANPTAPVFRSSVVPDHWTDLVTGEHLPLEAINNTSVASFCGLANPAAFFATLTALSCRSTWEQTFPDHHAYSGAELRSLIQRAHDTRVHVLLTTEKDAANLPPLPRELSVRLLSLAIHVQIENERDLLALIERTIAATVRRERAG